MSGYLKNKRVYISSPIENGGDYTWDRAALYKRLEGFGLDVYDPIRHEKQVWKTVLDDARSRKDYEVMREISRNFCKVDLHAVDKCDLLFGILPYRVCTTGCHHEITHALNIKRPVILVCPQGKELIPLWYFGLVKHEMLFGSFDEGYNYLREVDEGLHVLNRKWSLIYDLL